MEEWDVEKYKTHYESEEHWELRRRFMLAHKERIPEDEIVCLASVFCNIELLGCRYPENTMRQVAELSKELSQDYRTSRLNMLKRTFVSASDAAASKVAKAPKTSDLLKPELSSQIINEESNSRKRKIEQDDNKIPIKKSPLELALQDLIVMNQNLEQTSLEYERMNLGKLETVMVEKEGQCKAQLLINSMFIAESAFSAGQKSAKKDLIIKALEILNKKCYKINKIMRSTELNAFNDKKVERKQMEGAKTQQDKIESSNLGFKMLQKLGWGGGSLGAKNQGIVDPISCQIKIGRSGLGKNGKDIQAEHKLDTKHYENLFRNFKNSQLEYDLIFSNEFSKDERAALHKMAQRFQLKTKSFGEESQRQLVIKGKRMSPFELRNRIQNKDPIFSEMYELIPPDEENKP